MREELKVLANLLIGEAARLRHRELIDYTEADVYDGLADMLLKVNREMTRREFETSTVGLCAVPRRNRSV